MNLISDKIDELQAHLQKAAFLAGAANAKDAHAEIFLCTALVAEIKQMCASGEKPKNARTPFTDVGRDHDVEVAKVRKRLKLWAIRPNQYNARILNSYLRLEESGPVTESALRSECMGFNFESNFAQMKIIAERNHGKIFEQEGDIVSLWPPIEAYVRGYAKTRELMELKIINDSI